MGKYCQALEDNNSINILEPYNFENKVKLFHTSMQMINYFQTKINELQIAINQLYCDNYLNKDINIIKKMWVLFQH